jgi:hypothetical protein
VTSPRRYDKPDARCRGAAGRGVALRLGQPPEQLARAPGEARLTRPLVLGAAGEFGQGSVEAQAMGLLQVAAETLTPALP